MKKHRKDGQDDEAPAERDDDARGGNGEEPDLGEDDAAIELEVDEQDADVACEPETQAAPPAVERPASEGGEDRARELREQLLRTAADFDNYRKRMDRERAEERKHAASGLTRALLPVLDNLRRAMAQARGGAAADEGSLSAFVNGIALVETQLLDILKNAGLEVIDAQDQPFDPSLHEALMQEASDATHMTVLDVFEPGYTFQGRLLRPARVKVSFNPEGAVGRNEVEAEGASPQPGEDH